MGINMIYTCIIECPDGLVEDPQEFDTPEEARAYGDGFVSGCFVSGYDEADYYVIEGKYVDGD